MKHNRMLRLLAIPVLLLMTGSFASADTLTVDFDAAVGPVRTGSYVEDGIRFSPNYHFDKFVSVPPYESGYQGSAYISDDAAGDVNPEFAGSGQSYGHYLGVAVVYVDYFGKPFDLLSFYGVVQGTNGYVIESSKGGLYEADPMTHGSKSGMVYLSGDEWHDVTWVVLHMDASIGAPLAGFDHMTFQVPEPSPWVLSSWGLGLLFVGRRRRL